MQRINRWSKQWLRSIAENFKAVEIFLSGTALWWALILSIPAHTFSSSAAYYPMAHIAPEWCWAILFVILGAVGLHGTLFEKFKPRIIALTFSAGMWLFVAAMMGIGNIATTATGMYFLIFCLNVFACYKVGERRAR